MKTKKFLSMILSLILILNFAGPNKRYANAADFNEEEFLADCPKNSKGGYWDTSCAWEEAEKAILNGMDYVVMKDQGPHENEDLYFFTFRALDKILDELGLDPSEDRLREEWQSLEKERISYFSPLKNILRVGIGSLLGALGGNGLYSLAQSSYEGRHKSSHRNHHNHKSSHGLEISQHKHPGSGNFLRKPARVISKLGANAMMLAGATCIGLITSILLKIKHDVAEKKEYEIFDKEYKIYKLNSKKSVPLNRMLQYIKGSNYSLDAETLFSVHAMPKNVWMFSSGNFGLNYTEEEKASFPEKLKKLAQDIEKNLGRRLEKKDEQ